jgi:DNA-binding transcriptional MocR family regulator
VTYPDPRGEPDLRKEIAAYLAIARGIRCTPSQVFITAGFSGALGLAVRGLELEGEQAWMEDPGFPLTRAALQLGGMTVTPVPVDLEGIDIAVGVKTTSMASLAVVTPGQQAPLGMTMSLPRRLALLAWASARPSARRCALVSWSCRRNWVAGSPTSLLAWPPRRPLQCSALSPNSCGKGTTFAISAA